MGLVHDTVQDAFTGRRFQVVSVNHLHAFQELLQSTLLPASYRLTCQLPVQYVKLTGSRNRNSERFPNLLQRTEGLDGLNR